MAGARPTLSAERRWCARGYELIAGMDEVGRGCLAGPVVAAVVSLPLADAGAIAALAEVNDSKLLSPGRRAQLVQVIEDVALGIGVGVASSWEIDHIGIVGATRMAMARAVRALGEPPQVVLIDALRVPELDCRQQAIIKGDRLSLSIAAASIVAKVRRDGWMELLAGRWPGYGFERHKGYGTAEHLQALARLGPCPIHRRSFAPVGAIADAAGGQSLPNAGR
jgi:ribonuclease HII